MVALSILARIHAIKAQSTTANPLSYLHLFNALLDIVFNLLTWWNFLCHSSDFLRLIEYYESTQIMGYKSLKEAVSF